MRIEGSIPAVPVKFEAGSTDVNSAIEEFRAAHPGAQIEAIDDRAFVGECEACGEAIFEDDAYGCDPEDGCCFCETCVAGIESDGPEPVED